MKVSPLALEQTWRPCAETCEMDESYDPYLDLLKKCLIASIYDESAWKRVDGPLMGNLNKANLPRYLVALIKTMVVEGLSKRSLMLGVAARSTRNSRPRTRLAPIRIHDDWSAEARYIQFCVEDILRVTPPGTLSKLEYGEAAAQSRRCALLKKHGSKDRSVWCADSFEGLPRPDEHDRELDADADFSDRADLRATLEDVKKNFARSVAR